MGSGSTGKAAVLEGFQFIGIEREVEYLDIATRRIADVSPLSGLRNILDSSPQNDTSGHEQPS
jgi:site-specific DNA-methyltransferase (adenine-specific)